MVAHYLVLETGEVVLVRAIFGFLAMQPPPHTAAATSRLDLPSKVADDDAKY